MKAGKWYALIIVGAVLFSACGIQNKFASPFGKRRYTKGFYVDFPGKKASNGKGLTIHAIDKMPLAAAAHELNNTVSQQPEIQFAQISQQKSTGSFQKNIIAVKSRSVAISQLIKINTTNTDTPAATNGGKSANNTRAVIFFLSAIGVITIATALVIAFAGNISLVATIWLAGAIVSGALDVLAVIFAVECYANKETDKGASLIILILNGAIVLISLLSYVRAAIK
jgi:hypothetical protein